ncbi:PREDICTED: stromal cell-derived factor 2-like isoform X2 [Polistes dominula]|uniref:Stromal cell-derived factor 2-like isoform X2 n=1 Tax=Polistes dominula TaxID=743375 RepID=A0ABM1J139_POLDO|nr:PREDICTED: stromal cell-derived factor 2-like isoform X2 [Polistes dominula]
MRQLKGKTKETNKQKKERKKEFLENKQRVFTVVLPTIAAIFVMIAAYVYVKTPKGTKYVTYGSVIKLMNVDFNVRLHSHDIRYGSGSGQQSVTGIEVKEDGNSYWLVKAEYKKQYIRGKPIKCNDIIRLEHVATKKNLHSHLVTSPLSGKQEISAFGDFRRPSDSGDNWQIVCQTDFWERNDTVMLKHVDTNAYLSISGRSYTHLVGQMEVIGDYSYNSQHLQWKTMEGLFVHPADFKAHHFEHTEL